MENAIASSELEIIDAKSKGHDDSHTEKTVFLVEATIVKHEPESLRRLSIVPKPRVDLRARFSKSLDRRSVG